MPKHPRSEVLTASNRIRGIDTILQINDTIMAYHTKKASQSVAGLKGLLKGQFGFVTKESYEIVKGLLDSL